MLILTFLAVDLSLKRKLLVEETDRIRQILEIFFTKSNFFFRHFPPKRVVRSSSPIRASRPAHQTAEAWHITQAKLFQFNVLKLWKCRPSFIISTFKSSLKTYLFKRYFISEVM